jgi:Flp pilus assembly protein TadG
MASTQKSFLKGPALRQAFRRLMSGEEGAALVEATIIAPILVAMGVYLADFGLLFYNKMEMQNAAQAGAQWAMANRVYNSSFIQVAGQNATPKLPAAGTAACTASSPACVKITSSPFCGCSTDSSGNAVVTSLAAGACTGTTNVINLTCPSGHGVVGSYVTVTAETGDSSGNATLYHSLVPYGLITSTYNISATTTVRIQ